MQGTIQNNFIPETQGIDTTKRLTKNDPKEMGEGVVILMDEPQVFQRNTEVLYNLLRLFLISNNLANIFQPILSLLFFGQNSIAFPKVPYFFNPLERGMSSYMLLLVRNHFNAELTIGIKDRLLFVELKYFILTIEVIPKRRSHIQKRYFQFTLGTK